jgi:hypothetical protein
MKIFQNNRFWLNFKYNPQINQVLINQGRIFSNYNLKLEHIKTLEDVEWKVFSQWGDDGIIDWLVSRLGDIPETFIEFGVENYRESNTRFLLQFRNWKGLVFDGSKEHIKDLQKQDVSWKYDLVSASKFIDAENINNLIREQGFEGGVGLLSIDIDGNDYWVWKAIQVIEPVLVIVEYNALLGDVYPLSIPYRNDFVRSKFHYSNVYYGTSINALRFLSEQKGYTFLGTNSNGVNAYFVRNDFANKIVPFISYVKSFPGKFKEGRSNSGLLSLLRGSDRLNPILDQEFIRVDTGEKGLLKDFGNLYSDLWQ